MEKSNIYKSNGFVLFGLKYQQDQSWPKHETNSSIFLEILLSILYINPESEPTRKWIAGRRQVCHHIPVYTVLTLEEIPEEGR